MPAIPDQHGCCNQDSLVEYTGTYYPEIQEQFQAPIVVAATAGARHAALMHLVSEKNISSPDEGKRQFAAGALSSLSFWALGMLPVHRSGNVYKPREPKKSPTTTVTGEVVEPPCTPKAVISDAAPPTVARDLELQGKVLVLNDVALPVPFEDVDVANFNILSVRHAF